MLGLFAPGCMGDEDDEYVQTGPPAQGNEVEEGDQGGQGERQRAQEDDNDRGLGYRGIVEREDRRGTAFYLDNDGGPVDARQRMGALLAQLLRDSQGSEGAASLSEARVAGILGSINELEIELAGLASEQAEHAMVQSLAQRMFVIHTEALERQRQLFEHQGLEAPDTSSEEIARAMNDMREGVEGQGVKLDRAFLLAEIDIHLAMLDLLDRLLAREGWNQQILAEMLEMRRGMGLHLEQAQEADRCLRREGCEGRE